MLSGQQSLAKSHSSSKDNIDIIAHLHLSPQQPPPLLQPLRKYHRLTVHMQLARSPRQPRDKRPQARGCDGICRTGELKSSSLWGNPYSVKQWSRTPGTWKMTWGPRCQQGFGLCSSAGMAEIQSAYMYIYIILSNEYERLEISSLKWKMEMYILCIFL